MGEVNVRVDNALERIMRNEDKLQSIMGEVGIGRTANNARTTSDETNRPRELVQERQHEDIQ